MDSRETLLSICIATRNRANTITNTLESIILESRELIEQDLIEVVIVDGNSSDNTNEVVHKFMQENNCLLNYFQEKINSGVDGDYDKAVNYAKGKYCWLMTDDDLLIPGAIEEVLDRLSLDHDLFFVDTEVRDKNFISVLDKKRIDANQDLVFYKNNLTELVTLIGSQLSYIGSVIIRKQYWMSKNRHQYLGSLFIHVGVLFQGNIKFSCMVISDPLIIIRAGNANWTPRWFEIWMFKWPNLIWSFKGLTDHQKELISPEHPWKNIKRLVYTRAVGSFSLREYKLFMSSLKLVDKFNAILVLSLPSRLLNFSLLIFLLLKKRHISEDIYYLLISKKCTKYIRNFIFKYV